MIRFSRVSAALQSYCDHVLVHTGRNCDYELNQVLFDDLVVRKLEYFLNLKGYRRGQQHGHPDCPSGPLPIRTPEMFRPSVRPSVQSMHAAHGPSKKRPC